RTAITAAKGESPPNADTSQNMETPLVRNLHALTALLSDGKRIILALAYPKPVLESFAQELSTQIARARQQLAEEGGDYEARITRADSRLVAAARDNFESSPSLSKAVEVVPAFGLSELIGEAKVALRKRVEPDVFEQPAGSRVEVDSFDEGGLTLRIPPA